MSISLRSLIFVTVCSAVGWAAIPAQAAEMFAPERVGRWTLSGGMGGYEQEDNARLGNADGSVGLFFSGSYRLSPNISLEADALYSHQDFDTPASVGTYFTTVDSRTDLYTSGIGALVKFILPLDRVELYAGAGLGIYTTTLRAEGTWFGLEAELEEDDTDVGYQAVIGADFYVSRRISLGLEYRRFKLDANFGSLIPGNLDAGGDFFLATVRGHF